MIIGVWIVLNARPAGPGVGLASPSLPPTPTLVAATPTAQPTQPPTPSPTAAPTAPPTAAPTLEPTASPASDQLADGSYIGDGLFKSFDGEVSYETAWRLTKTGTTVEIAQLRSPGGEASQVQRGIVHPAGLIVAVSDDPVYCEVLWLEIEHALLPELVHELGIAYGPATMTCPEPQELADFYLSHDPDPLVLEPELRKAYGWGNNVVIGSVATGRWTAE